MSSKFKRLADYRVRVLDQFPAEALEAALNEMAAQGYVLLHLSPAVVPGESQQGINLLNQIVTVPTQKMVLQCVFMRPCTQRQRLPGDEWKGEEEE